MAYSIEVFQRMQLFLFESLCEICGGNNVLLVELPGRVPIVEIEPLIYPERRIST